MLFPQLESQSKQSTSLTKHCWNFWCFHWKYELWLITCIVDTVEESGLLQSIIKPISSFFQCKGNNVRCKCIFPRKRRTSLALWVCCMTKVLIFLPWSSYTLGSVTGLSYFLMQISFMNRTLLNQSLFRQIHERKFYITLLKFCSIKHKACHWITKS